MNELELQSLCNIKKLLRECHHIDLLIRVGGEDRLVEADFLKDLILALPLFLPPKKRDIK